MSLAWILRAACRGADPETWFPTRPSGRFSLENPPPDVDLPAKRICGNCPVRSECLRFAMENEVRSHRHGIYGGLNPAERRQLMRGGTQ